MSDLADRTRHACDQLTRYGGAVHSAELAEILERLGEVNDNLAHMRSAECSRAAIERIKQLLDGIG